MSKAFTARTATATLTASQTRLTGESQFAVHVKSPSGEEDTANSMTVDFSGMLTNPIDYVIVQIRNASNVIRVPQGAVTFSGTTVTIADTGLVNTDQVVVVAFSSPLF